MPTSAANLGAGGFALLALTILCWLIHIGSLIGASGPHASGDAAFGQGFSWFVSLVFGFLTWLWLGGLLLKAGTQGVLPPWGSLAAVILYVASAAAIAAVLYLLEGSAQTWPNIIPGAIPPILAFYVLALYLPALRPPFSSTGGSAAVWGVVLILTLAPWPAFITKVSSEAGRSSRRAKEMEEIQVQQRAENRAKNIEKLQAMTPQQPLTDWYPLLGPDSGVSAEALEALRHIDRRQADIQDMLTWGIAKAMMLLPDLDLKATPQLCAAAQTFLLKTAKDWRVRPKQDPRPYQPSDYLDPFLPGIRWLVWNGCNCDEGIMALEASVGSYIESPDRNKAVADLANLRKKQ
jgi:hypothetical protein